MAKAKQFFRQARPWHLVLVAALLLALAAGFATAYGQYAAAMRRYQGTHLNHTDTDGAGWTYLVGTARGAPLPAEAIFNAYGFFEGFAHPLVEGQAVGYRCVLTGHIPGAQLVLQPGPGALVVFLDDAVLFTDLPGQEASPAHWPQLAPGLHEAEYSYGRRIALSLPTPYAGRVLTVVEYPAPEALAYWMPISPTIEDVAAESSTYLASNAPAFLLAGLLAGGVLLLAFLFCHQLLAGRCAWPLLMPLAYLAVRAAGYAALPDYTLGLSSVWGVVLFSLAYVAADDLLLGYLACKLKGKARIGVFALAAAHLCLVVGIAVHQWLQWHDPANLVLGTEWPLGLLRLAGFVLAMALAFRQWRRGDRLMALFCRLFIAFCGGLAVAALVGRLAAPALWLHFENMFISAFEFLNFAPLMNLMYAFMLVAVLLLSLYEFITQQIERNTTLRTLELKNRLALENYAIIQGAIRQTSLAQHELRNHTTALGALLDKGDYPRAAEYLAQWTQQNAKLAPARYGDNELVSAIVQNRMALAAELYVAAEAVVAVPAKVPVRDAELSSLLLNMLDNALEANARLPAEQRWLKLRVSGHDGMLAICCQNAWDGQPKTGPDGRLRSTKAPGGAHGYGLAAMQNVAESYGSLLDIRYDETSFTVQTCLQLPGSARAG